MRDDTRSLNRPAERKRVQMAVTLVIESDEAEYLATTVDLSPYGLRLQSDATLAPGQPVGLLLRIPMKVVSDFDLIPVTGSEVKPIIFGAKRRWRPYRA